MGWNRTPVRDAQWKVHPYWTKQSQALEQDRAAGGRDRRVIKDGGALGRVVLRRWHRRIYAELRWQTNNKECSKYLREVSADNRAANLAAAWQRAHELGLTSPEHLGSTFVTGPVTAEGGTPPGRDRHDDAQRTYREDAGREADFLTTTRTSYDRTATDYAERLQHHLDDEPIDQAMVDAFAALILGGSNERVIDVGCGTGVITAMLAGRGVDVFGIDLSPNMISQARRLNPGLQFGVGSMLALNAVADGSVGGVCAWYSIIHVPDEYLASVFAEFRRVLAPAGLVLLAFQVGDQRHTVMRAFDQQVSLTFFRRQPPVIARQLAESGFDVYAELVRQPDADGLESTPQAYLIARKI